MAAITIEDFIKPIYKHYKEREMSDSKTVLLGKFLAFGFGLLCIVLAFAAQLFGGLLQVCVYFLHNYIFCFITSFLTL